MASSCPSVSASICDSEIDMDSSSSVTSIFVSIMAGIVVLNLIWRYVVIPKISNYAAKSAHANLEEQLLRSEKNSQKDCLRIISLNTWLICIILHGEGKGFDLRAVEKRAIEIADRILAAEPDVVNMQEVFCFNWILRAFCFCVSLGWTEKVEGARSAMIRRLKEGGLIHSTTAGNTAWMKVIDSGLLICSRYPIIDQEFTQFPMDTLKGADKMSNKGSLTVAIDTSSLYEASLKKIASFEAEQQKQREITTLASTTYISCENVQKHSDLFSFCKTSDLDFVDDADKSTAAGDLSPRPSSLFEECPALPSPPSVQPAVVLISNAHLVADYLAGGDEENFVNRRKQIDVALNSLKTMVKKYSSTSAKSFNRGIPVGALLLGDFNIIGGSKEHKMLLETKKGQMSDLWLDKKYEEKDGATHLDETSDEETRLDFVFSPYNMCEMSGNNGEIDGENSDIKVFSFRNCESVKGTSLSDHDGLIIDAVWDISKQL